MIFKIGDYGKKPIKIIVFCVYLRKYVKCRKMFQKSKCKCKSRQNTHLMLYPFFLLWVKVGHKQTNPNKDKTETNPKLVTYELRIIIILKHCWKTGFFDPLTIKMLFAPTVIFVVLWSYLCSTLENTWFEQNREYAICRNLLFCACQRLQMIFIGQSSHHYS